jgi:hypothetical protein
MIRIRVVELATGYWQATFEGEEADAVIDRSPDQALASLVRANIRRLGIEQISYASEVEGTSGVVAKPSKSNSILPLGPDVVPERKKSS